MNIKTIIGLAVAAGFIFFMGVGVGAQGEAITKEVVKEVPVEKIVEVEKNGDTWRSLKTVDDKGFAIAADNMNLCTAGFKAVANLDVDEMNRVTDEVKANTATLNNLAAQRQDLLKKLGY